MGGLLGIDLGTSSVKTALIDSDDLYVLGTAQEEYPIDKPENGYAEQDPEAWWNAVVNTVRAVRSQVKNVKIEAISVSGQQHGTICLDDAHELIRPAIIWADTRSTEQAKWLKEQDIADVAPGPPAVGFTASTMMWLKENESETLEKTKTILLTKDYINFRLTGELGTDKSDASATWLFDIRKGEWSKELVELCGLSADYLPPVHESSEVIGRLTKEAAGELGVRPGIPVVAGSADLPAQALGYGLIDPTYGLVTVGTGGQVFLPVLKPETDPQLRYYIFNHSAPDRWYAQAAILSAGLSLRWLRDLFEMSEEENAYSRLSTLAREAPIGSDGLIFLPYLAGERSPHMDGNASGLFFGLRLHHEKKQLVRAVMEGVAFALRECLMLVGNDVDELILSGGASKSPVWRQILADVLERPLNIALDVPHACVGNAMLAGVGVGIYPDLPSASSLLPPFAMKVKPRERITQRYQDQYEIYQHLYPLLKSEMTQLQAVTTHPQEPEREPEQELQGEDS